MMTNRPNPKKDHQTRKMRKKRAAAKKHFILHFSLFISTAASCRCRLRNQYIGFFSPRSLGAQKII
jgi:hypothetical protein